MTSRYEVFFNLTRLEIELWERVDQALRAECGVPLGRLEALLVLDRLGPCRVQDVSRELAITVGGTSKLIDRVEASGHCRRTPTIAVLRCCPSPRKRSHCLSRRGR